MSYTFKGIIMNDINPESGTNLSIKGFEQKRIIQPQKDYGFKEEKDSKSFSFEVRPSAGGTDNPKHALKKEIKNGTEKINTTPATWEFEITASDQNSPVEIDVKIERVWS